LQATRCLHASFSTEKAHAYKLEYVARHAIRQRWKAIALKLAPFVVGVRWQRGHFSALRRCVASNIAVAALARYRSRGSTR
jgi:hypothetical protein